MKTTNLLPYDGEVYLFEDAFTKKDSDFYLKVLSTTIRWQQEPIVIFGKKVMQPRLTAWYGDPDAHYKYSGIALSPLLWTPELLSIRKKVEELAQVPFNSVLLNLYRDGRDSMGKHRDNEKELGIEPVIASVSFGATRTFEFRHRTTKEKLTVELHHGSILIMRGKTQELWYHAVPKQRGLESPRINLTYRLIKK